MRTTIFEAGGIYDANATYDGFVGRGGMSRRAMAEAHPTYVLPPEVADEGWYRGAGKETDDECRDRAKGVLQDLQAKAAGLDSNRNLMMVVHYDFIAAFLDAILVPETTGHFARWRHHNTAITVVDIPKAQGHDATIVNVNNIAHILDTKDPSLVSGFPL